MLFLLERRVWTAAALWACVALAAASPTAAAKKRLSLEDLTADPPISGRGISALQWLPDGRSFSFVVRKGPDEEAPSELWLEQVASGKKRLLLGDARLRIAAEPAAAGSKPPRPKRISLAGYRWSPDGRAVLLSGDEDLWLWDAVTGKLERLTHDADREQFATFSPDGKRVAFVRKNDLYALDLASRRLTRLTRDGSDLLMSGKSDWVYQEELAGRSGRAFQWSPDGRSIAYLRLDDDPIDPYPITDFLPVPPKVTWERYPKAGARNPTVSFRVVGADGTARVSFALEAEGYIAPSFSWTVDSKAVSYRVLNRHQNREEVRLLDVETGRSRTLFTEEDPYWLNDDGADPPRFLPDGRFLWKSERDGFAHLYVGSAAGGALRQITKGAWMVDRVIGLDQKRGLVYFTATEENVRRRPIYRVGLDGRGFTKLTRSKGTHSGELSPDGRHLLDTFSSVTEPPVVSLLDASGRPVRVVDRPENHLAEYELATTQEVEVKADDGATLEARLAKPADFDPAKKYPVIVYVYGGPHAQVVRDSWGATSLFDHFLASRGFLVWSLDNRGSWGRGHAWESTIFEETGKRELADQLAGVRYLEKLPYVDPARIGIWGWSYGGYMTLYALVNAPDVWKCGMSGAPVTHWKFYDTIYTERYMRTPQENPKGYEASAPLTNAKNLSAKLLLMHGTADDNVHMQNTIAFIDALVKAGKPFDLKLVPGQKHGFRGRPSRDFRYAAIAKFFEENL